MGSYSHAPFSISSKPKACFLRQPLPTSPSHISACASFRHPSSHWHFLQHIWSLNIRTWRKLIFKMTAPRIKREATCPTLRHAEQQPSTSTSFEQNRTFRKPTYWCTTRTQSPGSESSYWTCCHPHPELRSTAPCQSCLAQELRHMPQAASSETRGIFIWYLERQASGSRALKNVCKWTNRKQCTNL